MPPVELIERRTETSTQFYHGKNVDGEHIFTLEHGGEHEYHPRANGSMGKVDRAFLGELINDGPNTHGREFTHCLSKAFRCTEVDEHTGAMRIWFSDEAYFEMGGNPNLQGTFDTGKVARSFPNYDVITDVHHGIKRSWRLKKEPLGPQGHFRTFRSPVKFKGCTFDGNNIIDTSGNILARLIQPYCYEADKTGVEYIDSLRPVSVTFTNNQMTVEVNTTGMDYTNDIIVDPTLSVLTSSADNFVYALPPTFNYGGLTVTGCYGKPGATQRPIHVMDLSALPPTAVITNSIFSVFCNLNNDGFSGTLECLRLNQIWVEGTASGAPQAGSSTWNNYGAAVWPGGAGALGDTTQDGKATTPVPSTGAWADFDVTTQAQWNHANNADINNTLIRLVDEANPSASSSLQFIAKENVSANKPKQVTTYTLPSPGILPPHLLQGHTL